MTGSICPAVPSRHESPLGSIGWECCHLDPEARPAFSGLTERIQDVEVRRWCELAQADGFVAAGGVRERQRSAGGGIRERQRSERRSKDLVS